MANECYSDTESVLLTRLQGAQALIFPNVDLSSTISLMLSGKEGRERKPVSLLCMFKKATIMIIKVAPKNIDDIRSMLWASVHMVLHSKQMRHRSEG